MLLNQEELTHPQQEQEVDLGQDHHGEREESHAVADDHTTALALGETEIEVSTEEATTSGPEAVPESIVERMAELQAELWQTALAHAESRFAAELAAARDRVQVLEAEAAAREPDLAELAEFRQAKAEAEALAEAQAQESLVPLSPLEQLQRAATEVSAAAKIEALEARLADAQAAVMAANQRAEAAEQRAERAEEAAAEARAAVERSRRNAQRANASEQATQARLELLSKELAEHKAAASEAYSVAEAAREEAAELRGQIKALTVISESKPKKK